MKNNSREIRIFISSTFRDMHPERDYLMNHVFPRLREEAAGRGVTLTEVDLRWGVTAEESESFKVIEICLDEIENSHPFFIGLLGDRYGWVPTRRELEAYGIPERYEWISDDLEKGMSITEIEMQYGVLRKESPDMHAAFYIKNSESGDSDPRLSRLKRTIESKDRWIHRRYADVEDLGSKVYDDFMSCLDALFPAEDEIDNIRKQRQTQWAIIVDKCKDYLPIETLDSRMSELLESDDKQYIAIEGNSGTGKSALAAHTLQRVADADPDALIVSRFSTGLNDRYSPESVILSINEEIRDIAGMDAMEIPEGKGREALEATLAALPENQKVIIMLDAVENYVADSTYDPSGSLWIPKLGTNVKLIISYIPDSFQRPEGFDEITVGTLSDEELALFITRYLLRYGKKLEIDQLSAIFNTAAITNTMVLTSLLDELRHFGSYDNLTDYIKSYEEDENAEKVLLHLLKEKEKVYGVENVVRVLLLLFTSVEGLREDEIISILGITPLAWSTVKCGCTSFIANRNGLYTLSHTMVRNAVYGHALDEEADGNNKSEIFDTSGYYYRVILEYLDGLENLEPRHYAEKVSALQAVGTDLDVYEVVSSDDYLKCCYENGRAANFIKDWAWLQCSEEYEFSPTCYLAQLMEDADPQNLSLTMLMEGFKFQEAYPRLQWLVILCVQALQAPHAAICILRALSLATGRLEGDDRELYKSWIDTMLVVALRSNRRYKEALIVALDLLDNNLLEGPGLHSLLNNIAEIYICLAEENSKDDKLKRKYYENACSILEPLLEERIRTSGYDSSDVAITRSNLAGVLNSLGRFDRALEHQTEALSAYRKAYGSNSEDLAIEFNNFGKRCIDMGEYDRALDAFTKSRTIYGEIYGRIGKEWLKEQRAIVIVLLLSKHFEEAIKESDVYFSSIVMSEDTVEDILDELRLMSYCHDEPNFSEYAYHTLVEWVPKVEEIYNACADTIRESMKTNWLKLLPGYTMLLSDHGESDQAMECLERNVSKQPDVADCSAEELLIRIRLANFYSDHGMYREAVDLNLSIIENYRAVDSRDAGVDDIYILALGNIGAPYIMLGEYDKAEMYTYLAIEERRKREDCDPEIISYFEKQLRYIANIKNGGSGNDNRTDPHDQEAVNTADMIQDPEARRLFNDGYDNYRRALFCKAANQLIQAIKHMKQTDTPCAAVARAYKYLALSYEYSPNPKKAMQCYEAGRQLAESCSEFGVANEITKDEAEMFWNAGDFGNAEKLYWDQMYLNARDGQFSTASEALIFANILAAMEKQKGALEDILSVAASSIIAFPETVEGAEDYREQFFAYANNCLKALQVEGYAPSLVSIAGMADYCFRREFHRPLAELAKIFTPLVSWVENEPKQAVRIIRLYIDNYLFLGRYTEALICWSEADQLFEDACDDDECRDAFSHLCDQACIDMRMYDIRPQEYCSVFCKPESGPLLKVWEAYECYNSGHKADALHECEDVCSQIDEESISMLQRGQAAYDAAVLAYELGRKRQAEKLCRAGLAAIKEDYDLTCLSDSLNELLEHEH